MIVDTSNVQLMYTRFMIQPSSPPIQRQGGPVLVATRLVCTEREIESHRTLTCAAANLGVFHRCRCDIMKHKRRGPGKDTDSEVSSKMILDIGRTMPGVTLAHVLVHKEH